MRDRRPNVSVLSEIAGVVFPAGSAAGVLYYAVQATTLAVLVLAANTAFQHFPRLVALLAHDGFLPRQFAILGDRLAFSNGILVLAGLSAALLLAFAARVESGGARAGGLRLLGAVLVVLTASLLADHRRRLPD